MNRSLAPTLAAVLLVLATTARAAGTSVASDVSGDYQAQPMCRTLMCEPYQDILSAGLSEDGLTLHLTMEVAAAIPAAPVLALPTRSIHWGWRLDLDPATSPSGGLNLPPGIDSPFELSISVIWDGTQFIGRAQDRRPLLTGGEPIVTQGTAVVNGTSVSLDLPLAPLDLPSSFRWRGATNAYDTAVPSMAQYAVDNTPFVVMTRTP